MIEVDDSPPPPKEEEEEGVENGTSEGAKAELSPQTTEEDVDGKILNLASALKDDSIAAAEAADTIAEANESDDPPPPPEPEPEPVVEGETEEERAEREFQERKKAYRADAKASRLLNICTGQTSALVGTSVMKFKVWFVIQNGIRRPRSRLGDSWLQVHIQTLTNVDHSQPQARSADAAKETKKARDEERAAAKVRRETKTLYY